MREQINNNPVLQIGLIAVLLVAAGFMLLSSMGGGEGGEEGASAEATATVESPAGTASLTVTTPTAGEATASAPGSVGAVVPRPRLPQAVREAIAGDRTVVLLVVKRGGIDDARVEAAVETLSSRPRVASFVVPVDQVSRYTAVTQPVELERAPALIVVRPRRLSKGLPSASVNYGFQNIATVVQAVVDAEYRGPELQYHP